MENITLTASFKKAVFMTEVFVKASDGKIYISDDGMGWLSYEKPKAECVESHVDKIRETLDL